MENYDKVRLTAHLPISLPGTATLIFAGSLGTAAYCPGLPRGIDSKQQSEDLGVGRPEEKS
jgi:hypothetical protein